MNYENDFELEDFMESSTDNMLDKLTTKANNMMSIKSSKSIQSFKTNSKELIDSISSKNMTKASSMINDLLSDTRDIKKDLNYVLKNAKTTSIAISGSTVSYGYFALTSTITSLIKSANKLKKYDKKSGEKFLSTWNDSYKNISKSIDLYHMPDVKYITKHTKILISNIDLLMAQINNIGSAIKKEPTKTVNESVEEYIRYIYEKAKESEKDDTNKLIDNAIECLNNCKDDPSNEVIEIVKEIIEKCSACNNDDESED